MVKAKNDLYRHGKYWPIYLDIATYAENGSLAIQMLTDDNGFMEPWSMLTVNLSVTLPEGYAYVDTNNNGDEILDWIIENELGELTGELGYSGFCIYPLVKFNLENPQ